MLTLPVLGADAADAFAGAIPLPALQAIYISVGRGQGFSDYETWSGFFFLYWVAGVWSLSLPLSQEQYNTSSLLPHPPTPVNSRYEHTLGTESGMPEADLWFY